MVKLIKTKNRGMRVKYGDFPYSRTLTFSELMLSSAIASHRVFELISILSIADIQEIHET